MADEDEKSKAEKLAAAKKRVAQLQKQKAKKNKKANTAGDAGPKDSKTDDTLKDDVATTTEASTGQEEGETAPITPKDAPEEPEAAEAPQTESVGKEEEAAPGTEPMPEAPTSPGPDAVADESSGLELPKRGSHARQASLSVQSKLRSSSFRRTSVSNLQPLSPEGDTMPELFRRQALRLEELEKENRRLEKERETADGRWKKSEEQLDDLRESNGEVASLKDRLDQAEKKVSEIEKLKAEIASLQRQNSHLSSKSHRSTNSVSPEAQPGALVEQLESKSATIEAMELEISNLRAQLNSQSTSRETHETQIAALEEKLSRSENKLEKTQRELTDTKQSLTRAAEKAVQEGVDKTSTDTLIKNLERQVQESENAKAEADKKIENLEKKLQALTNLHKESEARNQTRLRESEKFEKDATAARKKLALLENENLRLREERDRAKKREVSGEADEGLEELEDEERQRLERRVRELEGENFDLRRGVWKEKRREMSGGEDQGSAMDTDGPSPSNAFDDVDLIGGLTSAEHSRRRSIVGRPPQHSSFSTVLSSGIAAFTGNNENRGRAGSHPAAVRGSLELLDETDDGFDEAAFARAQAEEEARKRVEWVREVKRKLKDWQSWRLDLVDSRAGAEGVGVGIGPVFEV